MKAKTFSGGYRFSGFKGAVRDEIISLDVSPEISIPLYQGFGVSPAPEVKSGDTVYSGQIIAKDDSKICSPIHSSVNGTVVGLKKRNYFKREVDMVVIKSDGTRNCHKLKGCSEQWTKLSNLQIEELIYKSGVSSLDREGIPTHFKTSIICPSDVEDLIIHGVGSEVYNASLNTLLKGKNLFKLIEGLKILKTVMPGARVHMAINSNERKILEAIKKLTVSMDKFNMYPVVPKYPQGYDEVLVPTLLGKKFPYGYSAANIGIVVLNIQAVLQVYAAVAEGSPLIERTVALCGPGFKKNVHVKVRVGTPLNYLLEGRLKENPCRIVLNSLLTGPELNDFSLPVNRAFSQIIAIPQDAERKLFSFLRPGTATDSYSNAFFSIFTKKRKLATTNQRGDQRPCIQCGYCIGVCPVRIAPAMVDRYIQLGINDTLMRYGIFNCIECNLCSYICPSKIPLSQNIKVAKTKLIEVGCDQSLCTLPKFNLKGLEEYKGVKKIR